jgi:hypothetical protein
MGEAHEWDGSRLVAIERPVWFPAWRSMGPGFQEAGETNLPEWDNTVHRSCQCTLVIAVTMDRWVR